MKNVLLIIPDFKGTIASLSFTLYRSFKKIPSIEVYAVVLDAKDGNPYMDDPHVLVLPSSHRSQRFTTRIRRVSQLKKLKRDLGISLSISTLLGATLWNVLTKGNECCIGLFHTKLAQRKATGIIPYFFAWLVYKLVLPKLDVFFAVNQTAKLDLERYFPKSHIELVYNIHDFEHIKGLSHEAICEEKEIFEKPVILYVGSLYMQIKAPDRLIRAFAIARRSIGEDVNLVFVGKDPEGIQPQLLQIARENRCLDHVFFLGQKSNPYKYMKACIMLVSPSRDEGLPGVLIESLSLGKKVVATNSTSGIWEIMECWQEFDKDLSEPYISNYGVISPNKLDDEPFSVQKLAESMVLCYRRAFPNMADFNIDRFAEDSIVREYLKFL